MYFCTRLIRKNIVYDINKLVYIYSQFVVGNFMCCKEKKINMLRMNRASKTAHDDVWFKKDFYDVKVVLLLCP